MLKYSKRRFGEILVAEGIVDKDTIDVALADQATSGQSIGEILMQTGKITEIEFARGLATQMGFPFIRMASYQLRTDLIKEFSAEFLYRNRLIPLDKIGGAAIVAVAWVPPEEVQQFLAEKLGASIYYYLTLISEAEATLRDTLGLSQDKMVEYSATTKRPATAGKAAGSGGDAGEDGGGNWQFIFDEAERNLSAD